MSTCDKMSEKMSECVVALVDELKFWQEVITEFMEWDEASQQRWADAQLKKFNRESDMTLEDSVKKRGKKQ